MCNVQCRNQIHTLAHARTHEFAIYLHFLPNVEWKRLRSETTTKKHYSPFLLWNTEKIYDNFIVWVCIDDDDDNNNIGTTLLLCIIYRMRDSFIIQKRKSKSYSRHQRGWEREWQLPPLILFVSAIHWITVKMDRNLRSALNCVGRNYLAAQGQFDVFKLFSIHFDPLFFVLRITFILDI